MAGEWWVKCTRASTSGRFRAAARRLRPQLRKGPLRRAEVDELLAANAATRNGVGIFLTFLPPGFEAYAFTFG
ncbi:MAG TPA: hypothetical protein VFL41_09275 [Gaiellaceae bacterium]|nr:hypothetical protein [Gaiellaceae bacterium]